MDRSRWYLRYDYRNQMVDYEDQSDSTRLHRCYYDCFGRRVAKITDITGEAFPAKTRRYVQGGQASWQTLAEYDSIAANPALVATYVHGNYIDEPLSMRRDTNGPAEGGFVDYFYHQDDLFNVVAVTDGSGTIVERVTYGDYGMPTVTNASGGFLATESTIGNPYLFTGREWEPEIRFYQYRTRYMEPALGRFTTRDWIGTWGDWFNFGNGSIALATNPMSRFDPFGLQVSVNCARCTKSSGDFKMTCCINDSNDPSYKKCTSTNDYPGQGPKNGNQPSETPGDPYGRNGPLEPGTYDITNHPMGWWYGKQPVVTNDPNRPNSITTTRGTSRGGIMFHDQRRYSNGCITCTDHSFDDELERKIEESGGRIPLQITDAGKCPPEEDESCGGGSDNNGPRPGRLDP